MRRPALTALIIGLCILACSPHGSEVVEVAVAPSQSSDGIFLSDVIDFGADKIVYRWEDLNFVVDLAEWERIRSTEYCLTNNVTPNLGNPFWYAPVADHTGRYRDYEGKDLEGPVVASHDLAGRPQERISFNWPGVWNEMRYEVLFDFKQKYDFTRVTAVASSRSPHQFLPHLIAYTSDLSDQPFTEVGDVWFSDDVRAALGRRRPYGGEYEMAIDLETRGRFLKLVFHKPEMGADHVLVHQVHVWGRVADPHQLVDIRYKAVSDGVADSLALPARVFTSTGWLEHGDPVSCPTNRFLRLMVSVEPLFAHPITVKSVVAQLGTHSL